MESVESGEGESVEGESGEEESCEGESGEEESGEGEIDEVETVSLPRSYLGFKQISRAHLLGGL